MRAIALISALAMMTSLFLPWFGVAAFNGSGTLWDVIAGLRPEVGAVQAFVTGANPMLLVLLGSVALAVVFVLASALGYPSQPLALIGGGLVFGLIGYALWQTRQGGVDAAAVGMAITEKTPIQEMPQIALSTLRAGAWCWAIGGILLFMTGTVGYGNRR